LNVRKKRVPNLEVSSECKRHSRCSVVTKRGKKKKHTIKSQVVIETQSLKVMCTAHGTGKEHDFQFLKRSQVKPFSEVEVLADKGYQGLKGVHQNNYTPVKKQKKKPLSLVEKQYNQELAKQRIFVEHVIR